MGGPWENQLYFRAPNNDNMTSVCLPFSLPLFPVFTFTFNTHALSTFEDNIRTLK